MKSLFGTLSLALLLGACSSADMHTSHIQHNTEVMKQALANFDLTKDQSDLVKAMKLKKDPDGLYRYQVETKNPKSGRSSYATVAVTKKHLQKYFGGFNTAMKRLEATCGNLRGPQQKTCYKKNFTAFTKAPRVWAEQFLGSSPATLTGFTKVTCGEDVHYTDNPYTHALGCHAKMKIRGSNAGRGIASVKVSSADAEHKYCRTLQTKLHREGKRIPTPAECKAQFETFQSVSEE